MKAPDGADRPMPRSRHEQLEQLTKMFGEAEPLPAPPSALLDGVTFRSMRVTSGPTFTPTPGTLDETRVAGRLFWAPSTFPFEQELGWCIGPGREESGDPRAIHIEITHPALDGHRRPRTPAACEALRADIERYRADLGVYHVTVDQLVDDWTLDTVRDLAILMDALLPRTDDDDHASSLFQVSTVGRHRGFRLRRYGNQAGFVAHVHTAPVVRVAKEWCRAFGPWFDGDPPTYFEVRLSEIDRLVPKAGGGRHTPPTAPASPPQDVAEDEDDLDAIEKAARRSLHGERAIPDTSREQPAAAPTSSGEAWRARARIIDGICRLSEPFVQALAAQAALYLELQRLTGKSER